MDNDEYNKVELPALKQLQALDWDYCHGSLFAPELSNERQFYREVVLEQRLMQAVKKINPWINDENLRKVIREITHPKVATLIEANQFIWETLVQYQSVEQDIGKGRKGQTVKLIDFEDPENNNFLCVNQFKIEGVNHNIIPDIMLFVNGLPLAVIECKSPYITNPMESGIEQLMRYANQRQPHEDEGAEKLFWYNQMMVSTFRDKARVGTISSRNEHYLEWKDPYPLTNEQVFLQCQADAKNDSHFQNKLQGDLKVADKLSDYATHANSQQILIAGLFNKANFLDVIQNFTVFEPTNGKVIKKISRYQQYRAVHKTIERIKTGANKKERGGVIWHTQGSGKSLTMVFLAIKMRRDKALQDYKLLFITDRTQLDSQLKITFEKTQGETVYHAKSMAELKALLQKDASDLVIGMIQKFQENDDDFEFPVLNESAKIVVLVDEAHRTQYGGLGVAINTGLPNAAKIAFTGTPLIKTQKTHNEFGSYIDTYTIEQAVADGATVQILYEGRESKTKITGDSLDSLFDEYFKDKTMEEKLAIKNKYGTKLAILEAPQRIRWICLDIIKHYKEHIAPNGFKGMIVTPSRRSAVLYKKTLNQLGAPQSEVIISASHNDESFFTDYTDAKKQKQHIANFKKPLAEQPLSILVVKDMLLTGFDAPVCQVMYLDRQLREHSLLQAIARVNRTAANKQRGFIVDYYGLSDYLTEALDMFSAKDIAGVLKDLKDEIPKLKATHTRVMKHFKGLDKNDIDACILVLKNEAIRQQFEMDFRKFCKQMDIIMPDVAAKPYLNDLKLLGKINHGARNLYRDSQLNISGVGEKVRKLIDEHIYSTGVDPKIPPVDLLSGDFKEKLNEHKSGKSKASEIEHAIKHHISVNVADDPEYFKSLAEKLKAILEETHENWGKQLELLMEFRGSIASDHQQKANELGLSETEFAFYNILIAEIIRVTGNESIDEAVNDEVKNVVNDLVTMLDSATDIVNFFDKQDEIKVVKRNIKRRILDTSFDDEELRKVVMDRFMELARVKFK